MASKKKPPEPDPDKPGDAIYDWGEVFIAALSEGKSPTDAAIEAGVSRQAPYQRRQAHSEFAAAWEVALQVRTERLEAALYRRAVYGMVTATTWERDPETGERVKTGETRKFSDTTGVFLLKAYDPERFRDRIQVEASGQVDHQVTLLDGRNPVEVDGERRRQAAALLREVIDGTEAA